MTNRSLMLIGPPDSGKSNYLGRLWEAIRGGSGSLKLIRATDIEYLEDTLAHLLQGEFAPRSNKNIEESRQDIILTVATPESDSEVDIVVPDVTGELWKAAVATSELPAEWMERLEASSGALLFLRVLSEENVQPLDWVTSRALMRLTGNAPGTEALLPTQVLLSELLRFLQLKLQTRPDGSLPRLSIVVTAWDRLDPEQGALSPFAFIQSQFPLFAGRLQNIEGLHVRIFGVSIVGGDLDCDESFKKEFCEGDLRTSGYTVLEVNGKAVRDPDLTLPVSWLVED
jgi:Double-GTPase 1